MGLRKKATEQKESTPANVSATDHKAQDQTDTTPVAPKTEKTPYKPAEDTTENTSFWNHAQDYMRTNWGDFGNWLADNGENVAWAGGTAAALYGLTGLMDTKGKHKGKRALLSAASMPIMLAAGKHIVPYYKNVWEQYFNKPKA